MKHCFSYQRFSSSNQIGNTSIDRQSQIAPKVASEKGWTYHPELNAEDLAVSAYKGDNIKTIEAIIESVKAGKIPQGYVMIIEAFDRFSRADLDTAEDLLKKVLKAGLEIYVYRGGHHLTRESINRPIDRIVALLELAQANEYSAKLSDRVKKAFDLKKQAVEDGKAKGSSRKHVPGWITPDGNTDARGRFSITGYHFNAKAKTVASICADYLASVGAYEIVRRLNNSNTPTLVDGLHKGKKRQWGQGVIYRLLSNHQLIGNQSYDGKGRPGFYDAVISEDTFLKIQAKLNDNKDKHGFSARNETLKNSPFINNVFSGVAFCTCGRGIKVERNSRGYSYIGCHGRKAGLCNVQTSPRLNLLEDSFLSLLKNNPEQLIQDEQHNQTAHNIEVLRGRKLEIEKQITTLQKDADEMAKLGMSTIRIQTQINERDNQLNDIDKQITLESAHGVSVKGGLETVKKIVGKLGAFKTDNVFRAEVSGWIRQHVSKITIDRQTVQANMLFRNGFELSVDLQTNNVLAKGQKLAYLGLDSGKVTLETVNVANVRL